MSASFIWLFIGAQIIPPETAAVPPTTESFSKIPTFKPFSYADIAASIPLAPQPRTIMSKSKLVFSTII